MKQSRPEIREYITSIRRPEARQVLTLRVLLALPWGDVATFCGAGVSIDAAKKRYERAIDSLPP